MTTNADVRQLLADNAAKRLQCAQCGYCKRQSDFYHRWGRRSWMKANPPTFGLRFCALR